MIKFLNLKDSKGVPIYGAPLLDANFHVNLPANTPVGLDVADGADACMISSTGHIIVSPFSDIALPVNPTFEPTSGALNRSIIQLSNLFNQQPFIEPDTLYFIAPVQTIIFVEFFSIT